MSSAQLKPAVPSDERPRVNLSEEVRKMEVRKIVKFLAESSSASASSASAASSASSTEWDEFKLRPMQPYGFKRNNPVSKQPERKTKIKSVVEEELPDHSEADRLERIATIQNGMLSRVQASADRFGDENEMDEFGNYNEDNHTEQT